MLPLCDAYFIFMRCISFPSGIPIHLSAHQPQQQLAGSPAMKSAGAVMTTKIKTARVQDSQNKSQFSGVACLLLLLIAGVLVKVAAFTPIFHLHWH